MNAYIAEFIGTALLVLLGDGVVANVILAKTKGNGSGWIVISIGWAMAVMVPALIFGVASGAHFNPALSMGLAFTGKLPMVDLVPYIIAQLAGAFCGACLVWLMYRDHFAATEDPGTILGVYSTAPAIRNIPLNFISELIATFVLVFTIIGMGQAAVGTTPALGTFGVAGIILVCGTSLGGTTGYAINPARDLGPRIAHFLLPMKNKGSSDWAYAWVPVVGPICGAILAAVLGKVLWG